MSTHPQASDHQVNPDWWIASDGRWYPPELHPNYVAPVQAAPPVQQAPVQQTPVQQTPAVQPGVIADSTPAVSSEVHETVIMDPGAAAAAAAASQVARDPLPEVQPGVVGTPPAETYVPPAQPQVAAAQPVVDVPPVVQAQPAQLPDLPPVTTTHAEVAGAPMATPQYTAPAQPAPTMAQPAAQPAAVQYTAPAPDLSAPPVVQPATVGVDAGHATVVDAPSRLKSPVAGLMALLAGALAVIGAFLNWGDGDVRGANDVVKALIPVEGFDSNGLITLIAGIALLIMAVLFFIGIPKQLFWGILAFIAGLVIVGFSIFSIIDIRDLSERYTSEWRLRPEAAVGDEITTKPDLGLWLTLAGGIIGALSAPFARRKG